MLTQGQLCFQAISMEKEKKTHFFCACPIVDTHSPPDACGALPLSISRNVYTVYNITRRCLYRYTQVFTVNDNRRTASKYPVVQHQCNFMVAKVPTKGYPPPSSIRISAEFDVLEPETTSLYESSFIAVSACR